MSIIVVALSDLFVAALCYFGGGKEIMRLTVVALIFSVSNIAACGLISKIAKIILAVVGYFWIVPKVIIPKGGSIANWIVGNGSTNVFYVTRVLALVFVGGIIIEVIANIDSLHGD